MGMAAGGGKGSVATAAASVLPLYSVLYSLPLTIVVYWHLFVDSVLATYTFR